MAFEKTNIKDLIVFTPKVFKDERGYFFESYNQEIFTKNGIETTFVQDNQSKSEYGTIRGLHLQTGSHAQAKLVRVLEGEVLDVAVDLRKDSATFGKHFSILLSAQNKKQLFVPRGFAHGFSVLSSTATFAYKCDNFYEKSSESGIVFNDRKLAIDWKVESGRERLSEKDLQLGSLDDFSARL